LSCVHYHFADFESGRQYAMRGVRTWRSGNVPFSCAKDYYTPVIACLCHGAMSEWNLGEIASCQANMEEAISIAKELKDMNALALALRWAAGLACAERNLAEVVRLASDLMELSVRYNFSHWLAIGAIYRGWARSASGNTAEGIALIEHGIDDIRATGAVLGLPSHLARKAEALHLADRTSEALEAISEAQALAERFEHRNVLSVMHRLRGVFLAALGADETQIEASFCASINIAREQKSISLEKRSETNYAEYRRQKKSALGEHGFRLPLW
jgi:hypothetical protein